MLIKEYRILLPMSVNEYRIAQLYMIQKKSREESHGEGSGVEILTNEPYTDGPGGSGQYTHKIYHVGSHLPGWFRAVLPKTALMVEELAWNAYPYTKTIYKCPFVEKLYLEIETCYKNDNGEKENVFDLSGSDIRDRTIDYIDIVKDQVTGGDYNEEEDPTKFQSLKTGRGPLGENWREEHALAMRQNPNQDKKVIMCAYKVCRVEFKYWGMQSKIERFIHDVGLRKTMVRAHRQAWAWQDEYHGLTIEDIRQLERETALALAQKMAIAKGETVENGEQQSSEQSNQNNQAGNDEEPRGRPPKSTSADRLSNVKVTKMGSFSSKGKGRQSITICNNLNESEWQNVESLEQLQQESSDEEFYDAKDEIYKSALSLNPSLLRSTSMDMLPQDMNESVNKGEVSKEGLGSHLKQMEGVSLDYSLPSSPNINSPGSANNCKTTILLLVLHGGSIVEGTEYDHTSVMKRSDINTLRSTIDSTILAHYPSIYNRIATRLVKCHNISSQVVSLLSSLSPFSSESSSLSSLPASAVSLFVSGSPQYARSVSAMIDKANLVYNDFLQSEEGKGFNGQVCLIGDSVGSILGYDALIKNNPFVTGLNTTFDTPLDGSLNITPENGKINRSVSSSNPDITDEENALQVSPPVSLSASCGAGTIPSQHQKHSLDPRFDNFQRNYKRSVSCSSHTSDLDPNTMSHTGGKHFDFEVTDFFILGSPLSVVLAYRKACFSNNLSTMQSDLLPRPSCHQIYNLFYPSDPSATRLEPLLCHEFHMIPPSKIPRYQKYPMGDGQAIHIVETLQSNVSVFGHDMSGLDRRPSNYSMASQVSGQHDISISNITAITSKWWGHKRIDYALYCPDALHSFPSNALPYLLHASFWESPDVIAFILRQVVRQDEPTMSTEGLRDMGIFKQTEPREKWLKRRTTIKVKNSAPNHRANDIIVLEDKMQLLSARFCYGPLDMVSLSGEKVDIHIMTNTSSSEWEHFSTEVTDNNGRIAYAIPKTKQLTQGLYPVKMVVKGDHTFTDFYLAVLPPKTECVVFSIDGSFTASVSIMGKDPKVKPGAVDVVRHWQELGYLIIYITARPDMQQNKVVAWLAQHNFPHGMVIFMDGVCTDPMRQKANYLKQRIEQADIKIQGAYGSSKDISVYQSIGLQSHQIFINGKLSKKQQKDAVMIPDGYASHLLDLSNHSVCRPAIGNARLFLRRGCFTLPGQGKYSGKNGSDSKRNTVRKTLSLPQRSSRTQSRESSPALFQHNESPVNRQTRNNYQRSSTDV